MIAAASFYAEMSTPCTSMASRAIGSGIVDGTAPTIEEATYKAATIDRMCRLTYDVTMLGKKPFEIGHGFVVGMKK